jgi:hypothetical protein
MIHSSRCSGRELVRCEVPLRTGVYLRRQAQREKGRKGAVSWRKRFARPRYPQGLIAEIEKLVEEVTTLTSGNIGGSFWRVTLHTVRYSVVHRERLEAAVSA